MTEALGASQVARFGAIMEDRFGISFDETRSEFVAEVLLRRIRATASSVDAYLERLSRPQPAIDELRVLGRELTVTETYFFRHVEQFDAFRDVGLARAKDRGRLRILSAGCASGEEPYSLAILVRELLPEMVNQVEILGIDVNSAMLEKAARARYSRWSLRETPPAMERRWFRAEGRDFVVADAVRKMVSFHERNLHEADPGIFRPEAFDVVFFRNVLMYFTAQTARDVVARIARSLAPDGLLFLGHAETLRTLSHDFHLEHTHGAFYYRRRDEALAPYEPSDSEAPRRPASTVELGLSGPSPVVEVGETWFDTIRKAAERVQALTTSPPGPGSRAKAAARPTWDLGAAVELLRRERYADAQALLGALPSDSSSDPDVLLLRAVLFVSSGQIVEAERTCAELLALDELSAGAHYVTSLCRESAGDLDAAIAHDRIAIYLDASFAMPRLHLGLVARRAGDRVTACAALEQAATLLEREEASRLLFFGGGFGREALIALCRAELSACGGPP